MFCIIHEKYLNKSMDKIFYYTDFRQYLAEYYAYMKAQSAVFSYRYFAKKAGISSSGLYLRVVRGERNLSPQSTELFIQGMNLSEREALYFRALVGFGQANTPNEKQKFYAVMLSMSEFVSAHQLDADEYTYLNQWYIPVIRELVTLVEVGDDLEHLGKMLSPPIRLDQVEFALALLQRLDFIQMDANGRWVQRDRAITSGRTSSPMLALARRSFNKQMIALAGESLDRFPVEERYATGMTLGISSSCHQAIIQEITAFRERIALLVDRDRGEQKVCQLNFQLFPLSQIPPEEK